MDLKHSHINIDRLYVMAMCGFGVCLCVSVCALPEVDVFPSAARSSPPL